MNHPTKKIIHHISEYEQYEKICEIKKARSPYTMLFCTNDFPDKWLINVIEYKTKSGVISDDYLITSKQLDQHIKFIGNSGWINITNF